MEPMDTTSVEDQVTKWIRADLPTATVEKLEKVDGADVYLWSLTSEDGKLAVIRIAGFAFDPVRILDLKETVRLETAAVLDDWAE